MPQTLCSGCEGKVLIIAGPLICVTGGPTSYRVTVTSMSGIDLGRASRASLDLSQQIWWMLRLGGLGGLGRLDGCCVKGWAPSRGVRAVCVCSTSRAFTSRACSAGLPVRGFIPPITCDQVIRENPASRGTEVSAEVLVGPPLGAGGLMNAGQQQWY